MAYEQKDDSGALFKNDKGDNPSRPDYTGNCMVGGKEMKIAAWLKESASGTKYLSLSFTEPFVKDGRSVSTPNPGSKYKAPVEDMDEDIPPF